MNIRSMIRRIGFTLGHHVYFVIIPTIVIDYDPYLEILSLELWLPCIDLGIYFDSKNTEKILKRVDTYEDKVDKILNSEYRKHMDNKIDKWVKEIGEENEKINNKKVSR